MDTVIYLGAAFFLGFYAGKRRERGLKWNEIARALYEDFLDVLRAVRDIFVKSSKNDELANNISDHV